MLYKVPSQGMKESFCYFYFNFLARGKISTVEINNYIAYSATTPLTISIFTFTFDHNGLDTVLIFPVLLQVDGVLSFLQPRLIKS